MKNKIPILALSGALIISTFAFAGVAFAQTTPPQTLGGHAWTGARAPGVYGTGGRGMMGMMGRGVYGTVVSNDGSSTITVTSIPKPGSTSTTGTTYTATVTSTTKYIKNGASTTLGNIAVGDTVMVGGKVSGTTITATTVRDGVLTPKTGAGINSASTIKGNGQPIIGGSVTAINGNSLTVTNASNVTYTVDVTNATVTKSGAASTLSSISVGDNVVIQGAVNGSSVTASSVMDGGANATPNTSSGQGGHGGGLGGFFGGIGGFFKHLFGF